jgi:hypothetical protein
MPFSVFNLLLLLKAVFILCLSISLSVHAAELSKSASTTGGPDIIFVEGDLTLGDDKRFIDVALNSENAIVVFQSPGGNLRAGMEIGRAIRLKGFSSYVPDAEVAAQSLPVIGALGGAAVNYIFIEHFQAVALGHFTVRRLERAYGKNFIQAEYERLAKAN